jgi:uncharacterized sporulation protein YeaH/YhbH (DUF444 family)
MVLGNIQSDLNRFKEIVRGRIRKDLRKFMGQGEMIGKKGKDLLSIPVPRIDIPRFRFGNNDSGMGQGEGQEGDEVGQGPQAGSDPAEHLIEVDVAMEDMLKILAEELELPRIKPKGRQNLRAPTKRYKSIRRTGPGSLRHHKRTYKRALLREISTGVFDPDRRAPIPIREDMRYRSWRDQPEPLRNAAVLYIMDVSGSMGDEQKHLVRSTAFWIDTWLQDQYQGVDTRYIIHDARAKEVDRETFFRTRENGGTLISSAFKLALRMVERDYPAEDWNLYIFQFSDGDNWSGDDTKVCIELLKNQLVPRCNQFSYGQVESAYGSGRFLHELEGGLGGVEELVTATIPNRDAIMDAIRTFLGTGR